MVLLASEALTWRRRLVALQPGIPENHYSYVEQALRFGDIETAKKEPCLYTIETLASSFDLTVGQIMRGL